MRTRHVILGLGALVLGGVALASELESKEAADAPSSQRRPTGDIAEPTPEPPLPPVGAKAVVVTISSITLGEDCGESPDPAPAPKRGKASKASSKPSSDGESSAMGARARRACEQTSMQLAVRSGAEAPSAAIKIKSVELYDDAGKLVGTLHSRGPSVWTAASGTYQTWDQKSAPGADLNVRYVLTAPDWTKVSSRWNRSYTVKAVITVGGADQKVERNVYLQGETQLPPGVVT